MRDYSTNGTAKGDRSHFAKPIGGFYRNGAGLSSDDASETAGRDSRFVIFDKKMAYATITGHRDKGLSIKSRKGFSWNV